MKLMLNMTLSSEEKWRGGRFDASNDDTEDEISDNVDQPLGIVEKSVQLK